MVCLHGVSKKFHKREALKSISLQMEAGCYGLLGPNGAGKTTLLRCILGLYKPNSGEIVLNDEVGRIGYLPQKFGMFREMTVYDMLYYFAAAKKIGKTHRGSEIERVLSLVNLEDRMRERVGRLSGGMQRRLGIAQALLGDPEVVLFDEPTAGLDPEERTRFRSVISKITSNRTVLISTHIVEDVESVCDNIIIMNEGTVLAHAAVSELCGCARGKVPSAVRDAARLKEPYYVEKEYQRDGVCYMRILSGEEQTGAVPQEPELLDGYLIKIKGV